MVICTSEAPKALAMLLAEGGEGFFLDRFHLGHQNLNNPSGGLFRIRFKAPFAAELWVRLEIPSRV